MLNIASVKHIQYVFNAPVQKKILSKLSPNDYVTKYAGVAIFRDREHR